MKKIMICSQMCEVLNLSSKIVEMLQSNNDIESIKISRAGVETTYYEKENSVKFIMHQEESEISD